MKEQIWCPLAFHSIMTKTDGVFKTCCVGKTYASDNNGRLMNRDLDNINQAFFSKSFEDIRNNLKNGIRDKNCQICWELEDLGVESYRISETNKLNFDIDFVSDIRHVDLALGNQCNLKCRTCNPKDSSSWIKEFYELDLKNKQITFRDFQRKNIFLEKIEDNFLTDFIRNTLSALTHISFFGGEPFLMNAVWEILEKAIDLGYADNLNLIFNTNGTVWDERKLKVLDKFKSVDIRVSIDGIGQRFEYLRYPAIWKEVENNLDEMIEFSKKSKQISLRLDCSVSALNIFYLEEILKFSREKQMEFYINPVAYPRSLGLLDIPEKIKFKFNKHLTTIPLMENEKLQFEKITKILFWKTSETEWDFYQEIATRDLYRNQVFSNVFPEYFLFLKNNGIIDRQ